MNIRDVLQDIEFLNQPQIPHLEIHSISFNSKKVQNDSLFVAISGGQFDGHHYIEDAIKRGAVAIVGEKEMKSPLPVPYFRVRNSRESLAKLSSNFYHNPSKKHMMIGVTGTNGKTTTTFILKHLFEEQGLSCTMIGSVMNIINGENRPSIATTPDSLELNRILSESNDDVVIMEVSSHALAQARVEGLAFDACLFTNLSHDHLDYHGSLEEYFLTKARLFQQLKENGKAIINIDTEWGERLFSMLQQKKVNSLSLSRLHDADYKILHVLSNQCSSALLVHQHHEELYIHLNMPGEHNIYNAAMAYIAGIELGLDNQKLLSSLKTFKGVPGRFEMFDYHGATIVVDYAHTADSFSYCLNAAKTCEAKSIRHVFGFRDGRDQSKRAEMVQVSSSLSDEYTLTLDDLTAVSPSDMLLELIKLQKEAGNKKGRITKDRTIAIKEAIEKSAKGDWVFVTGKGNEQYKNTYALPCSSDIETVQYVIKKSTHCEETPQSFHEDDQQSFL
ncbi:UDP-N-acetylmuramoyl-L-alanyl-D-glutamate--2,6-diaminopimelate ligase [Priestia endophytica]|uniref:UDP-N-acetylmuramoyl-L-alanyl-D-glutamate--2, 6-diaminopimelate ligase n=1 Tax=Priestia endophytica TaxID=135735 RepID=UPI003D27A86B